MSNIRIDIRNKNRVVPWNATKIAVDCGTMEVIWSVTSTVDWNVIGDAVWDPLIRSLDRELANV